jgi:hypothetical protein
MAMTFTPESVEVPANLDTETVCIDLYEDTLIPGEGGVDELVNTHMVSLQMSEDQAVELATLLMLGASKLRAERLAGQGL